MVSHAVAKLNSAMNQPGHNTGEVISCVVPNANFRYLSLAVTFSKSMLLDAIATLHSVLQFFHLFFTEESSNQDETVYNQPLVMALRSASLYDPDLPIFVKISLYFWGYIEFSSIWHEMFTLHDVKLLVVDWSEFLLRWPFMSMWQFVLCNPASVINCPFILQRMRG